MTYQGNLAALFYNMQKFMTFRLEIYGHHLYQAATNII